jgi:hypothetical protein
MGNICRDDFFDEIASTARFPARLIRLDLTSRDPKVLEMTLER